MLRIGQLDVPDKLVRIGIVAEPDEGLGVVSRHNDVVALVLTPQLSEILFVVLGSRMHLDRHVAVAVVGVVVVETDREVTAELLDALVAHDGMALLLYEREVGEVDLFAAHLHDDRHLHRNQVEYPGAVAHRVGQVAELLDVGSAPDAFQVDRLAPERIGRQRPEYLGQRSHRDHLDVFGLVRRHVVINQRAAQQLAAVVNADFEVGIVAAADHLIGRACNFVAHIGILSATDTQDRLLGGYVEVALHIVQAEQLLGQASVSEDDQHAAFRRGRFQFLEPGLERGKLPGIEEIFETALNQPAEQQRRVFAGVPLQIGIDHIGNFLLRFEHLGKRESLDFDAFSDELLRKQVDHARPVGGSIAVECHDDILSGRGAEPPHDIGSQCRSGFRGSRDDRLDGFFRKLRTVDGTRVVIREGVVHETHDKYIFIGLISLFRDIRSP